MNADEAAEATQRIRPKLAIPMHYGTLVGSMSDAVRFSQKAGCRVELPDKEV
jgi:L-ascorbate metabolism protein UlaG (beta-lactamase superfamily)